MDFIDQIKQFSNRIKDLKEKRISLNDLYEIEQYKQDFLTS